MATVDIPIAKVVKNATFNIKITKLKRWRFRLWLCIHLFKLGARIANMGIKIEFEY